MKKGIGILLGLIGIAFLCVGTYLSLQTKPVNNNTTQNSGETQKPTSSEAPTTYSGNFNADIIRAVNSTEKGNYLISPYSIEAALAMLKEGAAGTTRAELEKVIPTRTIKTFNVKERISVADALFIKDIYKNKVKKTFSDTLKNKYASEVMYDKFEKATVINNWVKDKTYGMIEKVVEDSELSSMILALANAIAIDVDWNNSFECINTKEANFTVDNTVKKVEMMHDKYTSDSGVKYIETNDEVGIVLPYASYNSDGTKATASSTTTTDLEFIAVLPNKDINTYVSEITKDKLNSLVTNAKTPTSEQSIYLSLPRFEYDYDWKEFKTALTNIGLKESMGTTPDYSNMINAPVYVSKAVHNTHISLNEKGTKAAAITYIQMAKYAVATENKLVQITFDKPFMYMIRDKKSGELLFFGVVKQPKEWKGSTCSSVK